MAVTLPHLGATSLQGQRVVAPSSPVGQAAWVMRRVGFGPTAADLERAKRDGIEAFVDGYLAPIVGDTDGTEAVDPWSGVDVPARLDGNRRATGQTVLAWVEHMVRSPRPVTDWAQWYWHGHLVTSLAGARSPVALVQQLRLFQRLGLGPFRELLRETTVDPAMLRYLDGTRSSGRAPNENYARELLELFALGTGNFTEADVEAAAAALTGWVTNPTDLSAGFRPNRHDDTPRTLLGVDGVHDVDSVIDAVVRHPSCPSFVAHRIAASILGEDVAAEAAALEAAGFAADGLHIGRLIGRLIERGLNGLMTPIVSPPIPWLVGAIRATDAVLTNRQLFSLVRSLGQVPMTPPNVAGWPSGDAWLNTSTTAGRLTAASTIAEAASPDGGAFVAADAVDFDALAYSLGRPEGFSPSTLDALRATGTTGRPLLALALSTPDLAIA